MNTPISVIVPLYNKERYIERCIQSVLKQSHEEFELIVVDDGSTDRSADIVRACRDRRLKLLTQGNSGPGAARNHGVAKASHELVAFLDGDDAWEQDYLKLSAAAFAQLPACVALLNWGMRIHPENQTTEQRWKRVGVPEGRFHWTPQVPFRTIIAILANTLPSSSVVRRKAMQEAGGFYSKYRCLFSEDAHLYLRLMLRHEIYFDSRPLTLRYEDASELALGHTGARPIEPFLIDPDDVRQDCPEALRENLEQVLAARALKTACVYGYWGKPAEARALFDQFVRPRRDWQLPLFWSGWLSRTALAPLAGSLLRKLGGKGEG